MKNENLSTVLTLHVFRKCFVLAGYTSVLEIAMSNFHVSVAKL